MFRKKVVRIDGLLGEIIRRQGLEGHLLQKRLLDSWGKVVGNTISSYTTDKYIRNQTLFVRLSSPALKADLGMMRSRLVKRLNDTVGSQVIVDIKFV